MCGDIRVYRRSQKLSDCAGGSSLYKGAQHFGVDGGRGEKRRKEVNKRILVTCPGIKMPSTLVVHCDVAAASPLL